MTDSINQVSIDGILKRDIPFKWIIDGWLHEMDYALLSAPQYSGKSTIALFIALSIAIGRSLSSNLPITGGPRRTIFIDEEMRLDEAERRMQRMMVAQNITEEELAGNLHYWVGNQLIVNIKPPTVGGRPRLFNREDIEDAMKEIEPQFIVFDSFSQIAPYNLNDAEMVTRITQKIKKLQDTCGATLMAVHHMRKYPAGDHNTVRTVEDVAGSYKMASSADTVWRCGWEGKGVGRLKPDKVRSLTRKVESEGLSYVMEGTTDKLVFEVKE